MGYILFITICVGSFILFKLAELKDNKLFLVLGVVALSLGAGLRNDNVGLDTYQYISAFKTNFSVIWLFKETGFREISRLLMNAFSGNTTCLLLLYAAVTNALILYRLWDFRKDCSYSYMAFLYITLHYMNTLNIMRQYIAIAIVFFATRFLEKKGYIKFWLAVLLASVFHSSALLGLFFFFVYYWKIAPNKQKKWMLFPLLIAIPIVFIVLMKTQSAQITNYFSQKRADVIDSVLLPTLANEQEHIDRVKSMTRRAIKTSTFIMAPLMMGLAFCATSIVKIVLTDKWLPCVPYLQIFCVTYMFWPIHTANLNAINAMGRSDYFLKLEIAKKAIGLILLLSTMRFGVMVMAYSLLISSITSQIINSWPNKKLLGYGYFEQLRDILPSVLIALFMGGCVNLVKLLGFSDFLMILVQVPLGAFIYVGLSALFHLEAYVYLKSVFLSIVGKNFKK